MRVQIVGDLPGSSGGIAQAMSLVRLHAGRDPGVDIDFVDPLRGNLSRKIPDFLSLFTFIKALARHRPDVLHLNTASRGSTFRNIILAEIGHHLGIKYIIHLHGGRYPDFMRNLRPMLQRAVKRYFAKARKIIVLTPSWQEFLEKELGALPSQIVTVANGTALPTPLKDNKSAEMAVSATFVYAGRLSAAKGLPELLSAFELLKSDTDAQLLLIGACTDASVEGLLQSPRPGVTILGPLPNQETIEQMSRATAVILPSHFENMPLTILEAMSVSTAVIASNVGGIPDMVRDGEHGVLVEPGDIRALHRAMREVCDPKLAESLGRSGREVWEKKYTSAIMYEQLKSVWLDAQK